MMISLMNGIILQTQLVLKILLEMLGKKTIAEMLLLMNTQQKKICSALPITHRTMNLVAFHTNQLTWHSNNAAVTDNMPSEVPASEFRQIDNARSKTEEAPKNGDVFNTTTQAKDDAEILMSQMYVLSFRFQKISTLKIR